MADGDIPQGVGAVHRKYRLLAGPYSGISPAGMQRMAMQMEAGCYVCASYFPERELTCRLVRRRVSTYWTVCLQCQGCGRALGGALSRADHPGNYRYPEWDEDLRNRAHQEQKTRFLDGQTRRQQELEKQREEYSEWLLTNPDWYMLRRRVLTRANSTCEACLAAPARHVHHVTYKLGKLPPAWLLRAVCEECHQSLHDGWRSE